MFSKLNTEKTLNKKIPINIIEKRFSMQIPFVKCIVHTIRL